MSACRPVIASLFAGTALACSRPAPRPLEASTPPPLPAALAPTSDLDAAVDGIDAATQSSSAPQLDPDGNDELDEAPSGALASAYELVRVGRAPLSLRRICDLSAHEGRLYLAHANQPLGTDGATLSSFDPRATERPFRVVFDWNRPGEPARGGGAGQGFVRIRRIEGRLFVPDADPPYDGFGLLDHGTEGYVFVSDPHGAFAPARAPHFRPPAGPDAAGKAGAAVVPRAYHEIDVVKFRGRIYLSTGSVPPGERAWRGPAPGALHVASADRARFTYEVGFPVPYRDGVWRLTYLVRFRDRLYAGIQDYDGKSPWDYVVFAPGAGAAAITPTDARPARVTDDGAASTLRWLADRGRLYWIAWGRDGVRLRVTSDGDTWNAIDLPDGVGSPTDVRRFRDGLVVLTTRALVRVDGETPVVLGSVPLAGGAKEKATPSPFALDDIFCSAPLGVLGGELYAGGQRDGALYRWDPK